MKFTQAAIPGVWMIEPEPKADARGLFARVFCADEFEAHDLDTVFVQSNTAFSKVRGTLRGLHFQSGSDAEVKLVRCTQGAVYDVVIDLRPDSPTFKQWLAVDLSSDNRVSLYIPRGCAHGYQTVVDDTELWYATTSRFAPAAASGVRQDDPIFGIRWPLAISSISDADKGWPDFNA